MDIFKIQPFQGKDTSGEYTLIALSIRYNGSVTVEPTSQGMFQVDYFTAANRIREANRDIITKETIEKQLSSMGLDANTAAIQADAMMKSAIINLLGGSSKEERYATLSQIVAGFGMELLSIELQDGLLIQEINNGAPAITPMQEV